MARAGVARWRDLLRVREEVRLLPDDYALLRGLGPGGLTEGIEAALRRLRAAGLTGRDA